jgi:hypothetical protein
MADEVQSKVADTTGGDDDVGSADQSRDSAVKGSKSNSGSEAEADDDKPNADDKPQTKTDSSTEDEFEAHGRRL